MKKLKTYGYKGKVECSKVFRLGATNFRFDFKDGSITSQGVEPAKYETSNAAYQSVIESSKEFKDGKIVVVRTIEIEEDEPTIISDAEAEKISERTNFPEVKTAQEARELLKSQFGAKTSDLQNVEAIRAYAAKLNVDFPNWN